MNNMTLINIRKIKKNNEEKGRKKNKNECVLKSKHKDNKSVKKRTGI